MDTITIPAAFAGFLLIPAGLWAVATLRGAFGDYQVDEVIKQLEAINANSHNIAEKVYEVAANIEKIKKILKHAHPSASP